MKQLQILQNLVSQAKSTQFGNDHHFKEIKSPVEFKQAVPHKDYEGLRPYFESTRQGQADVLWPGKPQYLAKTSGTTSGTKFIPITKASMPEHIKAARHTLTSYIHRTGKAQFVDGKMIFLQGSPALEEIKQMKVGRLSGIVHHHVPAYLLKNRLPTYKTNCIEDWEQKLDAIIDETISQDMRLISGIPPWVQMYFERLLQRSGAPDVKTLFPNFGLFVHGGVNFQPYQDVLTKLIGERIDALETYPASEGFIAFQNDEDDGLLLNLNAGMYFEFIPMERYFERQAPRLNIEQVELGVQYALIISSNAGLWAYDIGDTIKFVSLDPFKIRVTGRVKHFISAFGEHVIAEEVERAMHNCTEQMPCLVRDFSVAPMVDSGDGSSYHEWFIEFDRLPQNLETFRLRLDELLRSQNSYYNDLREGSMLQVLVIRKVKKGGFNEFMRQRGKLGGQNKVPRLANDRQFADILCQLLTV